MFSSGKPFLLLLACFILAAGYFGGFAKGITVGGKQK